MKHDYEWALYCWREMMAKYKGGRPKGWKPHLDYAAEPMREGEFRDPPNPTR